MNKKIEIKSLSQTKTADGCKVCFDITIKGNPHVLEYEVLGDGITSVPERSDAVVMTFLIYAIRYHLDIVSDYPMSEKLYYNIQKHIMPQIVSCNPKKAKYININVPLTKETYSGTWNATGISMGVDSFATIHEYTDDCAFDDYKLTHLVHLRTGSHWTLEYNPVKEQTLFEVEQEKVERFCEAHNYKLVTIKTNLYEICNKEFGRAFASTHVVRNLGTLMLLQNYFSKYFYASAYNLNNFKLNIDKAMGHYEKWLIPLLANENLEFFSANTAMERIDKTKYIAQFPDTYDHLHVCWKAEENCGECRKCMRTLVTLDILGVLDKYKNAFDVDAYNKNRKKIINKVVAMKSDDDMYTEIYNYMKANNIKTPGFFTILLTKISVCTETIRNEGISYFMDKLKRMRK